LLMVPLSQKNGAKPGSAPGESDHAKTQQSHPINAFTIEFRIRQTHLMSVLIHA